MAIGREHIDVTGADYVRREYHDREAAEHAVERLKQAGFADDQIVLTTHGARTKPDGTFVPGGLELKVTVTDGNAEEAERILAQD
jgi:hypothetical protein